MSILKVSLEHRTTVVIVSYNGEPWIRRCLDSVTKAKCKVIVVDNGSTDATCDIIVQEFHEVCLIRSRENLGFGRGNNLGISSALASGAEYIFLLNQDAYILDGAIAALEVFAAARPGVGVVSPLHCSPNERRVDPRTLRGYLQRYATEYLSDACVGSVRDHYPVHGVNAAAWFVRSEIFRNFGGFDPLFFMYGEDDDLLERWAFHQVQFVLMPASRVVHLRESPKPLPSTIWRDIWRRSERRRSEILTSVKRPGHSVLHMTAVLLAEGWVRPVAEMIVLRQGRDAVAALLAAARVTLLMPKLVRHARVTALRGHHFL